MKHSNLIYLGLCLLALLILSQGVVAQGVNKKAFIGNVPAKVMDIGDEGEGTWGWDATSHYYEGFSGGGLFSSKAIFLGTRDWTDTLGVKHNIKLSGHGQWETDDRRVMMPTFDEEGWTIHRYVAYQPPQITVDGLRMDDPFPFNRSDHVAGDAETPPNKIPGMADLLIESWFKTNMGITVHQRVIAFGQKNHDDYQIFEWTFKNTGDVDLDDQIELPNQTLKDVYFLRQLRAFEDPSPWMTYYGEMPEDTLRVMYGYPMRWPDADWDNLGMVDETTGYIARPWFTAEGTVFASAAVNDMSNDDEDQPHMTGYYDCDLEMVTKQPMNLTSTQTFDLYDVMVNGFRNFAGAPINEDARPGVHDVDIDERGYLAANEAPWWGFTLSGFVAYGPYNLAPGDSFRIAWAQALGTISPQKAHEIGLQWLNDDVTPPPGMELGVSDNLPDTYDQYPELYAEDSRASEHSNWAKDCWIHTGKDSLMNIMAAAQWAYDNNFDLPQPPPPPSIEVTSLPDRIEILWGDESEAADDFAGYRVYRAQGQWWTGQAPADYYSEGGNQYLGVYELLFECGEGTDNPTIVHKYDDTTAQRGLAYYYYVTAFDDGTSNKPDWHGKVESLESSQWANVTQKAANLKKQAASSLDNVVIVPNPYNISASELQFVGEQNKIMFLNLPLECTIRIYTESGDLIRTIEHFGSGDEAWGVLEQEHSSTSSDQLIVSGIYIAHFQTPEGDESVKKFVVVR